MAVKRTRFAAWEIDEDGWWWLYTDPGRDSAAWVRPDGDRWQWSVFSPWSSEEIEADTAPTVEQAQQEAAVAAARLYP